MVDITHKNTSLRIAIAQATVSVSKVETIAAIREKKVPKGDVFEMAKTAGLFAVKKTSDLIPDCHPLPVEFTGITYSIHELEIQIQVEVRCIYRTGVEVEAMHGASVVALTIYDMLKPIDKGIEIRNIKLLSKSGGKSDWKKIAGELKLTAAVVVCSDSISKGEKEDRSGKIIYEKLQNLGISLSEPVIIPDEVVAIQQVTQEHCLKSTDLLIFTGGTGLSSRDITPEALIPLLERRIPGIEEAIRNYGQERTALAMLSRSVAGIRNNTLILALPGSSRGAAESMDAIFPAVLHVFNMLRDEGHA